MQLSRLPAAPRQIKGDDIALTILMNCSSGGSNDAFDDGVEVNRRENGY
jgi:hypothetical protein